LKLSGDKENDLRASESLNTHTQLYSPFKAAQLYIEHTHIHAHTQMKLN